MIEPLGVTAERLFQLGPAEPLANATHRRVGGRPRKGAPGKAGLRRPSRRSIKVWICRYERAPLTIARIENRITPACPYIFPSARRRSGMAARQVRRSVVISNLRVGLLAMDSDRLPLRKRKDVLHGAAATFLSDRALNSPEGKGWQGGPAYMPKALSFDLRSRVLAAIDEGLSCRQAATRFGVSASSAIRWQGMRRGGGESGAIGWRGRRREGGDARPKPQGGDRLSRRTEAHAELIHAALAEVPDITLPELKARLAEKGAQVSVSALWRFCRRHRITRKKRRHMPPSRTGRIFASDARPGLRASSTLIPSGWCSSMRPGPRPTWPGATDALRVGDAFGSASRTGAGRQPPLWPGCARAVSWRPSC